MTYKEIFESLRKKSFAELVQIADNNWSGFMSYVRRYEAANYNTSDLVIMACIGSIMLADGELTDREQTMFNRVFRVDWSKDYIRKKIYSIREQSARYDTVYDWAFFHTQRMTKAERNAYLMMLLCFAACDGRIDEREFEFIYAVDNIK